MATRGLVGHKVDGAYHGVYNHTDSYPAGHGMQVLELVAELNREDGWDLLQENLHSIVAVDPEGSATEEGIKLYGCKFMANYGDMDGALTWYDLFRGLQGVENYRSFCMGELFHYPDSILFVCNSLCCEYAYVLDLDEGSLDLFAGFQREPGTHSPFTLDRQSLLYVSNREIYPCKFVSCITLDEIRGDWASYQIMETRFKEEPVWENNNNKGESNV